MSLKLFPRPKEIKIVDENLIISYPLSIALPEDLYSLSDMLQETLKCNIILSENACISFHKDDTFAKEAYHLSITTKGIQISYASRNGAYYGLVTLGQILKQLDTTLPCCDIFDEPALAVRGYMLDISRGKVPTLDDLCDYVDRLAELKYNQLQLYVEGFSFAYPSFPEVWKDATPITGEEICYLDTYCKARGIELVPNQNSLGHMAAWLARDEYRHLAETDKGMEFMGMELPLSTLDAMNPDCLDLVTTMMDDMLPFFSSDKFNVNLDEPFELGKGKNHNLAKEKGESFLYMDYLKRLHERVCARGKNMYMWGDILANHPETLSDLPKNITVLDWGYEAFTPFEEHAAMLQENKVPFILCPGTATWTTLTGRTDTMMPNILNAAKAAVSHGGEGILVTAWGDGGHLEYKPLNDTAIAYAGACSWGCLDTTEDEVANYLNNHVYLDKTNKAAQIIFDLGRLCHYEEFPMVNMTIANMVMSMGIIPAGSLDYALEQAARSIQVFAPSASVMIDALLAGKKTFDYAGAMASILDMKKRLSEMKLENAKASLIHDELENTLRIAEFAQGIHYLNASTEISEEDRTTLISSLKELGKEILNVHPKLWIARNKIHGMDESIANIKKICKQL